MSSVARFSAIRAILDRARTSTGFDRVISKVVPLRCDEGHCTFELTLSDEHLNLNGALHGGLTATLVDSLSTMALLTSKCGRPGVSVDLSVSYLKGVRSGEDIVIDTKVLKAGRTLAFLTVDIFQKATGQMVAQGKHTKFVGDN